MVRAGFSGATIKGDGRTAHKVRWMTLARTALTSIVAGTPSYGSMMTDEIGPCRDHGGSMRPYGLADVGG